VLLESIYPATPACGRPVYQGARPRPPCKPPLGAARRGGARPCIARPRESATNHWVSASAAPQSRATAGRLRRLPPPDRARQPFAADCSPPRARPAGAPRRRKAAVRA
jgi:hypothetical protein